MRTIRNIVISILLICMAVYILLSLPKNHSQFAHICHLSEQNYKIFVMESAQYVQRTSLSRNNDTEHIDVYAAPIFSIFTSNRSPEETIVIEKRINCVNISNHIYFINEIPNCK